MKEKWAIIGAILLTALVYTFYAHLQPAYTYALLDPRYDAHKYAQLYNYFSGLSPNFQISFPFNSRILMPWLAAQMPFYDFKTDFIWLNGIFIVLTIGVLVVIWQKLQIRLPVIFMGLFWVLFHWKGLVRMYLPDPVTADIGGYFFQSLWLGLIIWRDFLGRTLLVSKDTDKGKKHNFNTYIFLIACLITIFGTLQKEVFLAVVGVTITYFFSINFRKISNLLILIFIITLLTYFLTTHYFPASTSDWRNNAFISILRGLKRYISQPELFMRLPISWFLAFGSLWLVVIGELEVKNKKRKVKDEKYRTQNGKRNKDASYVSMTRMKDSSLFTIHFSLFTFHFSLWFFLSIFGGGDTTRILFNGMPFVLTFLLLKLNQKPDWVAWYILFTSLPLMRLFELEPDLGLYPQTTQRWCVECWTFSESWGYWLYCVAVLVGYYYLSRRLRVSGRQANEVNARR